MRPRLAKGLAPASMTGRSAADPPARGLGLSCAVTAPASTSDAAVTAAIRTTRRCIREICGGLLTPANAISSVVLVDLDNLSDRRRVPRVPHEEDVVARGGQIRVARSGDAEGSAILAKREVVDPLAL